MNKVKQAWLDHLGCGKILFPRDVGFPYRKTVLNPSQYIRQVMLLVNRKNCFVSVYSDYQIKNNLIDKIYIDLDSADDLNIALEDARKIFAHLADFNAIARCYFSGCKGFAIYIDISPMVMPPFAIKWWVATLEKSLNLKSIDHTVIGDVSRVSRIPYTLNFNGLKYGNTPKMCVPIEPEWSLDYILKEASNPFPRKITPIPISLSLEGCDGVSNTVVSVSKPTGDSKYRKQLGNVQKAREAFQFCISNAKHIEDGRHRIMAFLLIPALVNLEYDNVEIVDVCKGWLKQTGKSYYQYRRHIQATISRTREGGWLTWSTDKFFTKFPKLLDMLISKIEG